jgi:uncharacterized membrane protein
MLLNLLYVWLISMLPLIELRGAIPISQALDLPVIPSYIVCIIGNLIPIPFVYIYSEKFLKWGKDKKYVGRFCRWCLKRGYKAGEKLSKKTSGAGLFFGLMLFVGIPLPGTGAWTGAMAASILNMGQKSATLAITLGVILAGAIMMTASYFGFNLI